MAFRRISHRHEVGTTPSPHVSVVVRIELGTQPELVRREPEKRVSLECALEQRLLARRHKPISR